MTGAIVVDGFLKFCYNNCLTGEAISVPSSHPAVRQSPVCRPASWQMTDRIKLNPARRRAVPPAAMLLVFSAGPSSGIFTGLDGPLYAGLES